MSPSSPGLFSADYATARERFRQAASRLGWTLESHPIGGVGPGGEELTVDVGCSPAGDPARILVVSSGIHGVEGFFGSAVQLALLERWASREPPPARCVFLHGLNPYGFAWLRRFNEDNVDLNRNFLLPGEAYEGASEAYASLDGLLNPRRPPSRWEPFRLKAAWQIARLGMPALRQAVAGGQFEFPRGLFFGGSGPSRLQHLLDEHLGRWLKGAGRVVHLDFHTGLGKSGTWRLLLDGEPAEHQRRWLTTWIGSEAFETNERTSISYGTRGGLGPWCISRGIAPEYLFAVAEFGTYGAIDVLAGLRAENQAHYWGTLGSPSYSRAKERLRELFCPSSSAWRSQVLEQSLDLVGRSLGGLLEDASPSKAEEEAAG